MPIFRYHCSKCDAEFELLLSRFDSPAECPSCGDPEPEKLPSLIGSISSSAGKNGCAMQEQCASAGHCCSGTCQCHKH
ncbi:MAG: zinc ribbon domain-containing protein [Lentisphaeria bacterium]|nr:zinc ribbon domain-containing protein [Lentisphaerota bacterium]MBR2625849.1 zinc ribbon domain-containing protein [Lentisphaeria bacterium]